MPQRIQISHGVLFYLITVLGILTSPFTAVSSTSETSQKDTQNQEELTEEELDAYLLGSSALDLDEELLGTDGKRLSEKEPALSDKKRDELIQELLEDSMIDPWQHEWNLKGSLGFTDNALLTKNHRDASSFTEFEAEYLGFRVPDTEGNQTFLYALADYRHYSDAGELEDEYLAVIQGAIKRKLRPNLHWESSALYIYNDQVFGLSPTEEEIIAAPIKVHQTSWSNRLSRPLSESISVMGELKIDRITFADRNDDYWQPAITGEAEFSTELWSVRVGLESLLRDYDDRFVQDSTGSPLAGTHLQTRALQPFLRVERTFGKHGSQEIGLEHSYRDYTDNGPGYQDYDRFKTKIWYEGRRKKWSWKFQAQSSTYHYLNRVVSPMDTNRYEFTQLETIAEINRDISEIFSASLRYEWEASQSTRILDSYSAHRIMISCGATF